MNQIVDIRHIYQSFLDEKGTKGICFGFCLTWLGDILKERPEQKKGGWLSGWFTAPPTPERKAMIPSDSVRLNYLFERAFRKQVNYLLRYH